MIRLLTIIFMLSFSIAITIAHAQQEERLIQIGNVQKWMTEKEIRALAIKSHEEGHCGGFMDVTDFVNSKGLRRVSTKKNLSAYYLLEDRTPMFMRDVNELLGKLSSEKLQATVEKLSSFHNRYYQSEEGVQSMEWIASQFQKNKNKRKDIIVEFFDHKNFKQPSVIATIAGQGELADEIVVIGGHGDSINWGGGAVSSGTKTEHARAPGADDNASGTSTVLEIFRVLSESGFKPKRTLKFMIYAGEEKGLLGSQDIAEDAKLNKDDVVAVIQFDMTQFPGNGRKIHFITDNTNKELTKFTQMLSDKYLKLPWTTSSCGYACSDHASWTSYGYSSVFPFEADDYNPKIHTSQDAINKNTDFEFGLDFAKLGLAFAVELGQE
ncbi:MAG: M20/M25/M40 family metallo-hydrolase [Xanthomonadaceae bacterium]|nr:M20/M25/M40 family metallo-hydrolase [Xanthomonadaceae bacterium]